MERTDEMGWELIRQDRIPAAGRTVVVVRGLRAEDDVAPLAENGWAARGMRTRVQPGCRLPGGCGAGVSGR
jgi:hypothetical protein